MRTLPRVSIEYSPYRDEAEYSKILDTSQRLSRFSPTYYSITYGAGGSTKVGTKQTVLRLRREGFNAIPHLSWGDGPSSTALDLIDQYREVGVQELVVLRGDRPSDSGEVTTLHYAEELIRLLRQRHPADELVIRVGCYPETHPEAVSPADDIQYLQSKVAAGANECITQYFYNVDAFEDFRERYHQAGIVAPLVVGVMPITNYKTITTFSEKCGAEIPRWIQRQLDIYRDDQQSLRKYGVEVVSKLCERLVALNVPEFHFYTLNGFWATSQILKNLGYSASTPEVRGTQ